MHACVITMELDAKRDGEWSVPSDKFSAFSGRLGEAKMTHHDKGASEDEGAYSNVYVPTRSWEMTVGFLFRR